VEGLFVIVRDIILNILVTVQESVRTVIVRVVIKVISRTFGYRNRSGNTLYIYTVTF